ncbi:flagellar basal body P-ring formation chaperone FlgA [Marinobacter sp. OP 3.4]|uniref:flagellar basal body P-ring formation chaperone FlgA n=1 Tax=Marinobacter sp. OP 3.4 TaxID=3076501 RepID=UPI002E1BA3B7
MRSLIAIILIAISGNTALAADSTGPDEILAAGRAFMEDFVRQQQDEGLEASFTLGSLDPRLKLAPCTNDRIDVEFSSDPMETTQPSLLVSCQGERPWRMYLSVSLEIHGDAFVAARPLNRGDRITRAMVTTQRVQVNSVRQGTITRLDNLVGLEMKRSVRAGTPFTPHLVITPDAVARGDHVMITARNQGFAVSTRGKALANARIGEQVLVENLSSSRTLRARVVAPGRVEVAM